MKKYIEYFCENCNETLLDNEVFTNSLDGEETYYCQWCGCEVKEVNSYIDL
jgi:predicted SprT family Zn-dependent metalloprotease